MKQLQTLFSRTQNCYWSLLVFILLIIFIPVAAFAQKPVALVLERMPTQLETDFALSSMPAKVSSKASVYLLDPKKGYYLARRGTNGFICFVIRTELERLEFRTDIATAIS